MAAEKIGCKYIVAFSCGTVVLHFSKKLGDNKLEEKVFCLGMIFDASVIPGVYEDGIPVFMDTE